jgi:uncharacterized protein YutE (UPF0331/DUF86 family)
MLRMRHPPVRDYRRGAGTLARLDGKIVARVSEHHRIIAFRNILIHGYADIDERLVWDIVQAKLPVLRREIESLLNEA